MWSRIRVVDVDPREGEHVFEMASTRADRRFVHRTARIRLRVTRSQADRCYGLMRSAGDVWAWLLDRNRHSPSQKGPLVVTYIALCRELTQIGGFGELSVVGARSVVHRYSDAWFEAAKRRRNGQHAGFPRRKRALVPVRFYNGTFLLKGQRVRLPVAKGRPELWVRLTRPIPYPVEAVRAITLIHDAGHLSLTVTAAVPVERHDLDPSRVAGVDVGVIHPYALMSQSAGLLISGRAMRAECYLHLRDQQARGAKAASRAPKPGQRGSRRWRRYRYKYRRAEARHRRRIHQAHHEAAKQVIAFALQRQVGTLLVGDLRGINGRDAGRVHNLRLRQWRRTHLVQTLHDKAERAGIQVRVVDEHGTSSTCPGCRERIPKPRGRQFCCPHCSFRGHRDLVGAHNIAAKAGGGCASASLPALIEHRRAGNQPARRDRRRHLHDRRRSCLASGRSETHRSPRGRRSSDTGSCPTSGEDQVASVNGRTPLEGANVLAVVTVSNAIVSEAKGSQGRQPTGVGEPG
jgi:IS605 OrfB family transposase